MVSIVLVVVAALVLGAILWWRLGSHGSPQDVVLWDDEDEQRIPMDPTEEGFMLVADGPGSICQEQLVLHGRLQVFVRRGSQYALWRQFPQAIRYEAQAPSGQVEMTPDFSLSISETGQTYERYGAMPADQIVGKEFEKNCFGELSSLVQEAGSYRLRAHYWDQVSNWVDVEVEP